MIEEDEPDAHAANPSQAVDWRPRGWVTVALVLMLTALIVAFVYLRDEAAPWDGDLTSVVPATSNTEISAPVRIKTMLNAASQMHLSAKEKPPWEWDTPTLANVIETHSAVLDNFRDLLEENEDEWLPSSALWWVEDFGSSPAWKEIILLKQAEAAYLARREQEEPAFLAALDLAVLAHLFERIYAWPSFMHCSLEMHEHSAQSLAMLLQHTNLPAGKLHRLQEAECRPWAPSEAALSQAMCGYYIFEKRLILGPRAGEPPLPPDIVPARSGWLYFKPNATLHLFAESFRELKDEAVLSPFARVDQIGRRAQQQARLLSHGFSGPNQSGQEYFFNRIKIYPPMLDAHSTARARHAVVMTLFAIRTFVAKNGRLPKTLDDLVPDFLPKRILDPYSGELLRYDTVRGLVYSVGSGLKDAGGRLTPVPFGDPNVPTAQIGIGMAKAVGLKSAR